MEDFEKRSEPSADNNSLEEKLAKLDFANTEVAFSYRSDEDLKKSFKVFGILQKEWLVNWGSKASQTALKLQLPFAEGVVKNTVFDQFVGGRTLLECQPIIERMASYNVKTILDYGAEGKKAAEDFNQTMNETIRTIEFASRNEAIPVVSVKMSGLAGYQLLESIQKEGDLMGKDKQKYENVLKRVDSICYIANQRGVKVFFDGEESWIQDATNLLVNHMMKRYNQDKVVVGNTFQMYRKGALQVLIDAYNQARKGKYFLGAKLIKGGHLVKERQRAYSLGSLLPVYSSEAIIEDTFHMAIRFCLDNIDKIFFINSSHEVENNLLTVELIGKRNIPFDAPNIYFCQMYGLGDNLTFNLAKEGFNVVKFIPYGTLRNTIPYLFRRTKDNRFSSESVSREYQLILAEMKRRGLF